MRDVEALRRLLYAAALAVPLASSGCGGAPAPRGTSPPPGGQAAPDAGTVAVPDGRTGVLRAPPENCSRGQWCGPASRVVRFAEAVPRKEGCPQEVVDPDGTSLTWAEQATKDARAAGEAADTCCYDYVARCWDDRVIEGRPLGWLADTGAAHARVAAPWTLRTIAPVAGLPPALRAALANAWQADGLAEHASVASFARATLELMAHGAPPALLADVQRAALDEIRHAERAFALAARFGAVAPGPGPLPPAPPRALDAAGLARATFVEGCVSETAATLRAERALAGCRDPETAAVLERIARDEARHAALAWRTLAWLRETHGADVVTGLPDLFARLADEPAAPAASLPDGVDGGVWRAFGRLSPEAQRAAWRDALWGVVEPLLVDLAL